MTDDNLLPFCFPAVRRLGIAERLARAIPDGRDPDRVTHLLPDILRARIFAIACGYEDADDLDRLRFDPAFKLACGRLPDTGRDLCSQPTVSRWENAPNLRDLIRLMGVMVDLYCASYTTPPQAVTLDIDDTVRRRAAAPRQDALGHRDPRSPAPPGPSHPAALAADPDHHPRRRPLRPPRGHGVVRQERGRLHLRSARQRRARPAVRSDRRQHSHPPRTRPEALPAWLRRDELSGQIVDHRSPRLCPYRGDHQGPRYPLRRYQSRDRVGRACLRDALLRPRPGRELDQIAQGAARFRPHQLPQPARQPDAAHPAHRRLLAPAHRP